MAKRKRCSRSPNDFRNNVEVAFEWVDLGQAFSDFGVPQLDNLMQSRKYDDRFTIVNPPPTTNSSIKKQEKGGRIIERYGFINPPTNSCVSIYNDKNMEDRISELPNNILHFILSFLETREGARTCILSTRWRYLWTESVSSLNLTYANMFGYDYPKGTTVEFLMNETVKFRQRVDQVLQRCQSLKLDAFRVSYVLRNESTVHVDEWMKFVAARRVKELELDFEYIHYPYYEPHYTGDDYRFPFQEFDISLKYLHLRHCIFEFPCNFKRFRSLIFMKLDRIYVREHVLQDILSSCPSLEWLSLIRCQFVYPIYLKFVDPSLLLKHLHISCSINSAQGRIDVHDINLLSFEFGGSISFIKLSIKNVPLLTRFVVVHQMKVPFGILSRVTHVETLFISGWSTPKMPTLHVLNNLKQLVFLSVFGTSHLQQLVYFLEACPSLQKLEIDMGLSEERNIKVNKKLIKMLSRPGTSLENLKEVEIYGFEGFPEKVQFARYLLKNATLLEKMKISSAARAYQGDGKWTLSGNIAKQGRMSLRRVRKLLQKETRSSTELIIESI